MFENVSILSKEPHKHTMHWPDTRINNASGYKWRMNVSRATKIRINTTLHSRRHLQQSVIIKLNHRRVCCRFLNSSRSEKKFNDVYFFRKHTFLPAVDTRPHQQLPADRETKQQQRELLKADSYLKTGSNHTAHPQSCSRQASNSKFILSHSLFFSDFMCALSDLISCITSYDERFPHLHKERRVGRYRDARSQVNEWINK